MEEANAVESNLSLFDYYQVLQKRKMVFAVPFFVIFLLGMWLSLGQPKVYETTSSLLVESSNFPTVVATGMAQESFQTIITRFLEVAQSRDRIEKFLNSSPDLKFSIETILPGLSVKLDKSAPIIRLSLQGTEPKKLSDFLEKYSVYLVTYSAEIARESMNSMLDYIESQLASNEADLRTVEVRIKAIQDNQKIISIPDEMSRVLGRIQGNKNELAQLASDRENVTKAITRLRGKLSGIKVSGPKSPNIQNDIVVSLRRQLVDLEMEQMSIGSVYTPTHPKVAELKEKIEFIQKRIQSESVKVLDDTSSESEQFLRVYVEDLARQETAAATIEAKILYLQGETKKLDTEFVDLSNQKEAYTNLVRQQKIFEQSLSNLIDRKNQGNIQKQAVKGRLSYLSRAFEPVFPIKPNLRLYFIFTFALAFLMGLAMVSLAEQLDNSVKSSDEARLILGLPIKGLIQDLGPCQNYVAAHDDPIDKLLCTHLNPSASESETFRTLRTNILYSYKQNPFQTLMVASPTIGAGKSTVSSNIAITIAQAGYRVILVDTDLRRPSLHKLFRLDNSTGLTRLLTGQPFEEVIKETPVPRLRVLTTGPLPPNPSELLHNEGFQEVINFLKTQADFVIFDNPPVKKLTDSLILATKIQRVFFMVSIGMTDKKEIIIAHDLLKGLNCEIAGLICNRVPASELGGYYYYYGKS